jgi:hypothetical protein
VDTGAYTIFRNVPGPDGEFTLKDQNSFTTDFLHLTLDSSDHDDDGTVLLLRDLVNEYARNHGISYDDAAMQLSHMPDYEGGFEASLHEEDGLMVEMFAYPSDSSMRLRAIVDAIESGVGGWLARDSVQVV